MHFQFVLLNRGVQNVGEEGCLHVVCFACGPVSTLSHDVPYVHFQYVLLIRGVHYNIQVEVLHISDIDRMITTTFHAVYVIIIIIRGKPWNDAENNGETDIKQIANFTVQ